jgi:hypothetical protein
VPPVTAVPTDVGTIGLTEVPLTDPPGTVTDAPESVPPATAVPTDTTTATFTDAPLTDPPGNVTDSPESIPPVTAVPTDVETIGETGNQTGECPSLISQNGNMTFSFLFADREPNVDEERQLEDATYRFFNDTFAAAFPDTFVSFSGEETSSEFSFDALQYRLGFTGLSLFSPCAPPLDEFDAAIANADYESLVVNYVQPGAVAGASNVLVFVERAEYAGISEYA